MQRYAFLIIFLISLSPVFQSIQAQEINAQVTVNADQISDAGLNHVKNLEGAITEYINTFSWTDDEFEEYERIKANIQITISDVDDDFNFAASIVVQTQRPIHSTIQSTPVFIVLDNNWTFNYPPNKSLIHDAYQFDNLASLIDFYAYIILGFDYDTFSRLGGDPYFKSAYDVMNLAESNGGSGWGSSVRQGRNTLINSLQSTSFQNVRTAMYQYHRKGLDVFTENPEAARTGILSALKSIQQAKRITTDDYLFNIFFNTKYKELVAIFEQADLQVRLDAYNLLTDLDASHISEYDKLQ